MSVDKEFSIKDNGKLAQFPFTTNRKNYKKLGKGQGYGSGQNGTVSNITKNIRSND